MPEDPPEQSPAASRETSPEPGEDTARALRDDVDRGLRFLGTMGMQTRYDLLEVSARMMALVEELVARGQIDQQGLEARVQRHRHEEQARLEQLAVVKAAENVDKHALRGLPEIDCAARMHLCHARCCTLDFALSFQDLDEGVIKFDYGRPYMIRKHPGSHDCCHLDRDSRRCTAYEHRPAICRQYDCRNDRRVWLDFERRIPAPDTRPAAGEE